jgi:hypothetical protein
MELELTVLGEKQPPGTFREEKLHAVPEGGAVGLERSRQGLKKEITQGGESIVEAFLFRPGNQSGPHHESAPSLGLSNGPQSVEPAVADNESFVENIADEKRGVPVFPEAQAEVEVTGMLFLPDEQEDIP